MRITKAEMKYLDGIDSLLQQVLAVHHEGRPDLFRAVGKKYTDEQLEKIFQDAERPVFVAVGDQDQVLGYAFCIFERHQGEGAMQDITTLYIDDLCVDQNCRGQHVGTKLYEYVCDFAKEQGCYNVTLNVWSCNESARKFYDKCGLKPFKTGMEKIL